MGDMGTSGQPVGTAAGGPCGGRRDGDSWGRRAETVVVEGPREVQAGAHDSSEEVVHAG